MRSWAVLQEIRSWEIRNWEMPRLRTSKRLNFRSSSRKLAGVIQPPQERKPSPLMTKSDWRLKNENDSPNQKISTTSQQ